MHAAEQHRKDVACKRKAWKRQQPKLDASRLICLDESGVNTGMTRLYGRAVSHGHAIDAVPDTRFHRTTILSPVRLEGTIVPAVFEGALNGEIFKAYERNGAKRSEEKRREENPKSPPPTNRQLPPPGDS